MKQTTLASLCLASSKKYKDRLAFAMFRDGKICKRVTYSRMGKRARQIGMLLKELGVEKGGRVLLLCENCPQWPIAYFGIAFAGAVSVPMLTGFSGEQIRNIALHCGICAVCLSRAMSEKFETGGASQVPLIYIDSISDDEENPNVAVSINGIEKSLPLQLDEEDADHPQCNPDDLATIIYTSGTQGNSKGVMLSGANIISCAYSSLSFVKLFPRDRLLSVLPLAHSYECSLGLLAPLISGASVTYLDRPPSPSVLLTASKTVRPTAMITVPLFIEKMYRNAIAPKLRNSGLYKCPLTRPLAVRFAGRKLKTALGGRIRFFGIGGAPLSPEVETFLHRAKFPYSTGYGLTEAAPLVAGNTPYRFPVRSAGTSPQGVTVRIASPPNAGCTEGEIQVRGPNVMMGYYNDRERTAEAFTNDGWLRTGDLGRLDKKGRLYIMGRLKALILGPAGENIYPEEIEALLGSSRLVEDALVYSGEKGELVALVFLSDAAKAVEHALGELRSWANKKLAGFSRLSRIEARGEPFEKTPTMKIKRHLYI
jgi:long-chain acyl-CoA synthetase